MNAMMYHVFWRDPWSYRTAWKPWGFSTHSLAEVESKIDSLSLRFPDNRFTWKVRS